MPTMTRDVHREADLMRWLTGLPHSTIPVDLPIIEDDGSRAVITVPSWALDSMLVDLGRSDLDHVCDHDDCGEYDAADLRDAVADQAAAIRRAVEAIPADDFTVAAVVAAMRKAAS